MSGLFRKSMNDEGDVYTSLLSNQSFTAYLSDDLKPSNHSAGSSPLDDFTSDTYSFTSKTKTASTLSDNIPKSLLGSDKIDSYNYMDISHGEEHCGSRGSADHDLLGSYMDQNPGTDEDEENLGPALGSHSFPYVEDPSDEELNDYRSYRNLGGTPQTASPVKITLTGSQPSKAEPQLLPPPVGVSERENVLSVGVQGVPTVTLSEPEDDSPASTPNASPTTHHSQVIRCVDGIPLWIAPQPNWKPRKYTLKSSRSNQGPKPSSRDLEGSSAESGDSEIELVSEELPKASSHSFTEEPKNKVTFSHPNNPFDNTPVTKAGFGLAGSPASPTAYSILREEREAELDSDLIIESASEESPKREQGIGGPKQGAPLPSPLVSSTSPPRSTPKAVPVQPLIAEKAKNPVKAEEDRPSKPKPPTAAVPPEVRSEKPQQDDMHKPLQQDKGELGKPAVAMLLEGFNKQKG
ncbi:hypothetical protein XENOCAPTIV_002111 [Xenoophorus captivus]|uniref:Uncharacterized protein n=1 Tax=Xenoophorus captivus TaxID=1517983 RepID=A0ABV0SFZ3_9TELE